MTLQDKSIAWSIDPTGRDASIAAARAFAPRGVRVEVLAWSEEGSLASPAWWNDEPAWQVLFETSGDTIVEHSSPAPTAARGQSLRWMVASEGMPGAWTVLGWIPSAEPGALRLEHDELGFWLLVDGHRRCGRLAANNPRLGGLSQHSTLQSLHLGGSSKLEDVEFLSDLEDLQSLHLSQFTSLTGVDALSRLRRLQDLDLSECSWVTSVDEFVASEDLRRLRLFRCPQVEDLGGLSALKALQVLELTQCPKVTNLGVFSSLGSLASLKLGGSHVTSVDPVAGLKGLSNLDLGGCGQLASIDAIAGLDGLRRLDLRGCRLVRDVDAVSTLTELRRLRLSWCNRLESVDSLSALQELQSLDLSWCERLTAVDGLSGLRSLESLSLYGCKQLRDIGGLAGLPCLRELDLSYCPRLGPQTWRPLATLPELRSLEGRFTPAFHARIMASAAVARGDEAFVVEQMDAWLTAARLDPTEEGLLSAMGEAAGLVGGASADSWFLQLLELAASNDVRDVNGLFATVSVYCDRPVLVGALRTMAKQAESPLPPETLVGLSHYGAETTWLRDATLLALARGLESESNPARWAPETARVVRLQLDGDPRHPLNPRVHEHVLAALEMYREREGELGGVGAALFGSLASDHALAQEQPWRDAIHYRLLTLALRECDVDVRGKLLSEVAAGASRCADAGWSAARADGLIRVAANLDSDTSAIRAALARVQGAAGHWEEAMRHAFTITRHTLRDQVLSELGGQVMRSGDDQRASRALWMYSAIVDVRVRQVRLRELARDPEVLSDDVVYGELLSSLLDAPEALSEVTAQAIASRPMLAEGFALEGTRYMDERPRSMGKRAFSEVERRHIVSLLEERFPEAAAWLRGKLAVHGAGG